MPNPATIIPIIHGIIEIVDRLILLFRGKASSDDLKTLETTKIQLGQLRRGLEAYEQRSALKDAAQDHTLAELKSLTANLVDRIRTIEVWIRPRQPPLAPKELS